MNQSEITRLVIAMIMGYGILFFTMWLFKNNKKTTKDEKPKDLNTPEPIILIEQP